MSDPRWVGTIGNDESNVIIGTPGNDFIDGKGGKDVLTGGLGSDIFFISEKPISSDQADYITDFNPVSDRLRISRQAFGITSDIGNIPFITSKNLGGLQGTFSEYFIYDTATGQLTYDQNGSSPGLSMGGTVAVIYTNPGAGSFLTAGSIELDSPTPTPTPKPLPTPNTPKIIDNITGQAIMSGTNGVREIFEFTRRPSTLATLDKFAVNEDTIRVNKAAFGISESAPGGALLVFDSTVQGIPDGCDTSKNIFAYDNLITHKPPRP